MYEWQQHGYQKPPLGTFVDWGDPLCRGLLLQLVLHECGGPAWDQVSSQAFPLNTGTSWVAGSRGSALNFSGTASQIQYAASTSFLDFGAGATFSAECWFQTSAGASVAMGLLSKQQSSGSGILWKLDVTAGHKLAAQVNGKSATCATTCNDGAWHQGVLVYDQATVYLYQDGLLCASIAGASLNASNAAYFGIGQGYNGGGQLFTGLIGLARVWGRALSAAEVLALYVEPHATMLAPNYRRWFGTAAGGTAWSETLTESGWLTDALAKAAAVALSESGWLTDALQKGLALPLSDSLSLADALSKAAGKALADGLSLTDALQKGLAVALVETFGLTDAVAELLGGLIVLHYVSGQMRGDGITESGQGDGITEAGQGDGDMADGGLS